MLYESKIEILKNLFIICNFFNFSEACETEFKDLDDRKASILPYWVRALTMPEEYDETTGKFVPVDK